MLQSNEAHAPQLLSLCSGARELQLLKPMCPTVCALQQETPLQRVAPLTATREKPVQQRRPSTIKNKSTF